MTKHESIEPQYDDFKFNSDIDPTTIDEIVSARERFYAPTGTNGQRLAVYKTIPKNLTDLAPIVRMPAWSDDNGRPEGAAFDAYVAEATGRPVLAPNAPGVDFSEWRDRNNGNAYRMTHEQRQGLKDEGSFEKAGGAVLRATRAAAEHFGLEEELILHASSQGVALAGGAIRAALQDGVTLKGIVLAEAVNYSERSLLTLGKQFAAENGTAPGYLEENPDLGGESIGRWAHRTLEAMPGANWPYIRGLSRAAFLADMGDIRGLARDEQNTPVLMTRGTASVLSTAHGDAMVREHFKRNGVEVGYQEFDGHHHPYTMTVQSVVGAVNEIA